MSKPLDRLTLLETFVRIAERGSISGAARDLGLSQASASRHLKELEERTGSDLIRRTTHSLALTPSGRALLADARSLLAAWDALAERHGGAGDRVVGPLKVVAPVALGQRLLVGLAVDFRRAHPEVSLTWILEDHPIRFAEIGCDCWIKVGPVPDDTLVVRRLARVERLVVAAPDWLGGRTLDHPDPLSDMPFVTLAPFEGERVQLFDRSGRTAQIAPPVAISTNNIFAALAAVEQGLGAAIMPRWLVSEHIDAGLLVDILPDWRAASLDVNVAFLPSGRQPRRLTAFLEMLEERIRPLGRSDLG